MEALVPVAEGTWREDPWEVLKQEIPLLASWNGRQHPADGVRVVPEKSLRAAVALPLDTEAHASSHEDGLQLLLVDWTFGTEELSQYAAVMRQVEGEPFLCMHPEDADRCGLAHGDALEVRLEAGSVRASLNVRENMARGVMVLPRHGSIQWQELRNLSGRVPVEHIQKISTHT
jgi:NADH-quinone oxidoreductase subunit G